MQRVYPVFQDELNHRYPASQRTKLCRRSSFHLNVC